MDDEERNALKRIYLMVFPGQKMLYECTNPNTAKGVYLANDRDNLPSNKEAGVEGSDDEPPLIGTNQTEPASETENLLRESNAGDTPEKTLVFI
ncbi:hypothetical protein DY000_02004252 [Brassica cretica]|uniref:Uncharacterized protein n=1 Tax=Brassica cretica TaxID=69181 RepID=A0ABQ7C7D1_BRACR|nr:hypothetical protein DY000_02004252 [Brassica cretica]